MTGGRPKPSDKKVDDLMTLTDVWEADNAKIIMWINNYVTHSIGAQLKKCRLRMRSENIWRDSTLNLILPSSISWIWI